MITLQQGIIFGYQDASPATARNNQRLFREACLAAIAENIPIELPEGAILDMQNPPDTFDAEWFGWLDRPGRLHFIQRRESIIRFSPPTPMAEAWLFNTASGGHDPASPPAPLHIIFEREEGAVTEAGPHGFGLKAPANAALAGRGPSNLLTLGDDRETHFVHTGLIRHMWGTGSVELRGGISRGGILKDFEVGPGWHDDLRIVVEDTNLVGKHTAGRWTDSKRPNQKRYSVALRNLVVNAAELDRGGARNQRLYGHSAAALTIDGITLSPSEVDRAAALWIEESDQADWTDRYDVTIKGVRGAYNNAILTGGNTARLYLRDWDVRCAAGWGQTYNLLDVEGVTLRPLEGAPYVSASGSLGEARFKNFTLVDGIFSHERPSLAAFESGVVFRQDTLGSTPLVLDHPQAVLQGTPTFIYPAGRSLGHPLLWVKQGKYKFTPIIQGSPAYENGMIWTGAW